MLTDPISINYFKFKIEVLINLKVFYRVFQIFKKHHPKSLLFLYYLSIGHHI